MKKSLLQWCGLLGVLALVSYTAAVIFAPLAYPGYNWMAQAVSDLSATNAPSRQLWSQLSAFHGPCSIVCIMCVCIFVSQEKRYSKLFSTSIYLFAAMSWLSNIGYTMFPLSESGKDIKGFQTIMHVYIITTGVVLLSIISLVLMILAGHKDHTYRSLGIWAGIALAMMFTGAIGTGAVPTQYFGIVERFSVFAASGYTAVLGIYLFRGFPSR